MAVKMKLHFVSLVWLNVVLQAAKVYYVPETSTPPPMSMMQATAYNPVQGDIYYFSGVNDEYEYLDLFAAFNVRSKRWRYIEPSNDQHPGKRKARDYGFDADEEVLLKAEN
jgi:hypothetical protein